MLVRSEDKRVVSQCENENLLICLRIRLTQFCSNVFLKCVIPVKLECRYQAEFCEGFCEIRIFSKVCNTCKLASEFSH